MQSGRNQLSESMVTCHSPEISVFLGAKAPLGLAHVKKKKNGMENFGIA